MNEQHNDKEDLLFTCICLAMMALVFWAFITIDKNINEKYDENSNINNIIKNETEVETATYNQVITSAFSYMFEYNTIIINNPTFENILTVISKIQEDEDLNNLNIMILKQDEELDKYGNLTKKVSTYKLRNRDIININTDNIDEEMLNDLYKVKSNRKLSDNYSIKDGVLVENNI